MHHNVFSRTLDVGDLGDLTVIEPHHLWIVPTDADPTGAWAGQGNKVASYDQTMWHFRPLVYMDQYAIQDEDAVLQERAGLQRIWPLGSAICKKTAAQTLTGSMADVTTWASDASRGQMGELNTTTGVYDIDARLAFAWAEVDVDVVMGFAVTSSGSGNEASAQIVFGSTAQTPVYVCSLNSTAAVTRGQIVISTTLADLGSATAIKLQVRQTGGSSGLDLTYAALRLREHAGNGS